MGHNSDKLYITHSEHMSGAHGASSGGARKAAHVDGAMARLPFNCCSLTLKPFDTPVCTADGHIYDLLAIMPYLRQHGTDPVSGEPLAPSALIKLNFYKNSDGQYHDPVTFKVFNEHTAIVAIRTTGNVFSKEAVERLNVKLHNYEDLLTNEPFTKKDIIVLQDPLDPTWRTLSQFDYVKRDLKTDFEEGDSGGVNSKALGGAGKLLHKGKEETKEDQPELKAGNIEPSTKSTQDSTKANTEPKFTAPAPHTTPKYNTSHVSTNRVAASLTSTTIAVQTKTENALWNEEDLMFEAVTKKQEKGYVRLETNYGVLDLELFCAQAPRTCYNFIQLCIAGKYNETRFHRLIPGFMIQGGDPTGTGKGGESCWGEPFADEYSLRTAHKHTERGTLSMANHGPNTNSSQFFITFKPTPHLDGKHTVFGHMIESDKNETTLERLEVVPTNAVTKKPLKDVVLFRCIVVHNPYELYQKRLANKLEYERKDREAKADKASTTAERQKDRRTWFGTALDTPELRGLVPASAASGVGKYLKAPIPTGTKRTSNDLPDFAALEDSGRKKKSKQGFGNFEGW